MQAMREGISHGLVREDDLPTICLEKGFVTKKDLEFLEICQKEVETFQKSLYNNRKKVGEADKIRKLLALNRSRQVEILDKINKYSSFTVEGYANYAKMEYILRHSTTKKGKKCKFKKESVQSLVSFYTSSIILPTTIRYLSRTQPWANTWSSLKANGVVFPQGCQMTLQQQLLLMWSRMYDSIMESAEPPELSVLEDDDMLDGWLALQGDKESGREVKKLSQAREQYIIANNIDEAREIEKMNSPESAKIKRERQKALNEKGELKEFELPDVSRNIMIEKNRRATSLGR